MEKRPDKRDFQDPKTVFDAVNTGAKSSAQENSLSSDKDKASEMNKEKNIPSGSSDGDFLFPLHIAL
jgi:hypothetical protein